MGGQLGSMLTSSGGKGTSTAVGNAGTPSYALPGVNAVEGQQQMQSMALPQGSRPMAGYSYGAPPPNFSGGKGTSSAVGNAGTPSYGAPPANAITFNGQPQTQEQYAGMQQPPGYGGGKGSSYAPGYIGNNYNAQPNIGALLGMLGGRMGFAPGGSIPDTMMEATDAKIHSGAIDSAVAGRTDHLPVHVASGSYVIPADIISGMGEGNTAAGFKVAKRIFAAPAGMGHNMQAGPTEAVPVVVAGGEYILTPVEVVHIGEGSLEDGHRTLDEFVKEYRAKTVKTLEALPGPKKN